MDTQLILPTLILNHMPFWLQVVFFGALLSVIMSTASGTLVLRTISTSGAAAATSLTRAWSLAWGR